MSQAEERQLKEILEAYQKADALDPTNLKKYEEWYRNSATPQERAKDYKERPQASAPKGLNANEEKQLKAILEAYKKKNIDAKELKEYEKWYKESATPAERTKDFNEIKGNDKEQSRIDAPAQILVHLPEPATLTVNGYRTRSTSDTRLLVTPNLAANGLYFYQVEVALERGGMRAVTTRLVRVQPGEITEVNIDLPMSSFLAAAQP